MILSAGRKPRLRSNSDRGFTLIELALVAVIILAIITLSTPLFRQTISELTIRDASYNISKLINYAQERAVIDSKKSYKITFYIRDRKYQLSEFNPSETKLTVQPAKPVSKDRFQKLRALPKGITFTLDDKPDARNVEIIFYPDGHCTKAQIHLYDAGKRYYTITTKGFGGMVEVSEEVKK